MTIQDVFEGIGAYAAGKIDAAELHELTAIDPWFLENARKSRDGRLNAHESLEPRKTALVVVDMQNYFVAEGMPSYVPQAKTIVPNINRLARAVRASGGLVVWIQTDSREALARCPTSHAIRWNLALLLLAAFGFAVDRWYDCS